MSVIVAMDFGSRIVINVTSYTTRERSEKATAGSHGITWDQSIPKIRKFEVDVQWRGSSCFRRLWRWHSIPRLTKAQHSSLCGGAEQNLHGGVYQSRTVIDTLFEI
jgi:hypothetical protein